MVSAMHRAKMVTVFIQANFIDNIKLLCSVNQAFISYGIGSTNSGSFPLVLTQ